MRRRGQSAKPVSMGPSAVVPRNGVGSFAMVSAVGNVSLLIAYVSAATERIAAVDAAGTGATRATPPRRG